MTLSDLPSTGLSVVDLRLGAGATVRMPTDIARIFDQGMHRRRVIQHGLKSRRQLLLDDAIPILYCKGLRQDSESDSCGFAYEMTISCNHVARPPLKMELKTATPGLN